MQSCSTNCVLEGVTSSDWASPYGVSSQGEILRLGFVTNGQYGKNIGTRNYLMADDENYYMFHLKNKEFSFDVDVSTLPCGLNGALYFVAMDKDGGKSRNPNNKAGAKFGTGYCDAQCPHDIKWLNGETNNLDWKPSDQDPNSGIGHYGSCCPEMDIWEANQFDTAYTAHPCRENSQYRCEGTECGDNDKGQRYSGVCDKDGCDFNSYRNGDKNFFGPGNSFTIDSTKPFTVVTQFLTHDGTDTGILSEIKRFYVQNGNLIENSRTKVPGLDQYNSLTDTSCKNQKVIYKETDVFSNLGGLKSMGDAMENGMVLVMSIWDDHDAHMLWLDSSYPLDRSASEAGVTRGPCSTSSGNPSDVEQNFGSAYVSFSKIKIGAIGSTIKTGSFLE